jgi:hypothetical protein
MTETIDLGDLCVHCLRDTAWGSGLFVNRIPADKQDDVNSPHYVGYMCTECLHEDDDLREENEDEMREYQERMERLSVFYPRVEGFHKRKTTLKAFEAKFIAIFEGRGKLSRSTVLGCVPHSDQGQRVTCFYIDGLHVMSWSKGHGWVMRLPKAEPIKWTPIFGD